MIKSLSKYRAHIFKKPLIFFSALYLIITMVLILIFFSYYNSEKAKIIDDRFSFLSSTAKFNQSQLNNWLQGRIAQLEVLKVNEPLVKSLASISSSADKSPELIQWFAALKYYYGYDEILLVRNSKEIVYSTTNLNTSIYQTDSILCVHAILNDRIVFSDSDENYSFPDMIKFYVPLNPMYGNSYTLILSTSSYKNIHSLIANYARQETTLESVLVKPYKKSVVFISQLLISENHPDSSGFNNKKAISDAKIINTRRGFVEGIDYYGHLVIAIMQNIPNTTWSMITKINKSEFYLPVDKLFQSVILGLISSDLLLVIILILIWRKTVVSNYRKIAETEIEKTRLENRFEMLVNGVKDLAIFILDLDGNVISWNQGAELLTGYNSNEIIQKHISLFYFEDEIINKKPQSDLEFAGREGSFIDDSWKLRKDGSFFWSNTLISSLKDENTNIYGYLTVFRDLSDRRKIEDDMIKSRDFYLKLLDDFPNPVWRSGIDGKFNYFNKAWLKYTGRSIDEELKTDWTMNLHHDDKEKVIRNFNEFFIQRNHIIQEFRLKNYSGEYRWLISFGIPYYDLQNNFAGYLGSCYDIDERKKYEETINVMMRVGEQLYSSLDIDQILDSLVTESIHFVEANSGFACLKSELSYVVKRIYNIDHWEFFYRHYTNNSEIINILEKNRKALFISNINGSNSDQEIIKKYGVKKLLRAPLFGSSGDIIGFFELHYNSNKEIDLNHLNLINSIAKNASIAIIKSLNYEQLRLTEQQLRNSESELRDLAAQIQYARENERKEIAREIHDELGQLFTGIKLNISFLQEQLEQNQNIEISEVIEELSSVQQIVNKGIQTVRDISVSLRSYILDHLGLITAVQEYCREIERISNIKCDFSCNVEGVDLNDDSKVAVFRIIQEALTNILRHANASLIIVHITKGEKEMKILISDNGKGIEEKNYHSGKSMGILGMKERAIYLKGILNIESIVGKGTTVNLSIPV
ncbi:MAG TPA: PAS domain S-box protein [Melioribacteraceae bacterium]|nr:PAS domain S-box protein [Melioribacteraceae bacterium]